MTAPSPARVRASIAAGAVAGLGAGLVFATLHAFLIVPIWDRMMGGLFGAAVTGSVVGWAYAELYPEYPDVAASALFGSRYGALLWLAVVPVSLVDAVLHAAGVPPRYELVRVAVAVVLAVAAGAVWGWRRTGRKRAMAASAAATLGLTMAMGGPVPIAKNVWAFGIFLAVLPASTVAGAILGASVALLRRRAIAMAP
jgi:hypothetical protein